VQFEVTPATRDAVQKWIKQAGRRIKQRRPACDMADPCRRAAGSRRALGQRAGLVYAASRA